MATDPMDFFRDLPAFSGPTSPTRDRRVTEVRANVATAIQAQAIAKETAERLTIIEAFGADTYADGTVISFTRYFGGVDTPYAYAGIKAKGFWYLTGARVPQKVKWTDLLVWLVGEGDPAASEISVWDVAHAIGVNDTSAAPAPTPAPLLEYVSTTDTTDPTVK